MKRISIVLLLLISSFVIQAQDTLKVMQYNLLYYGVSTGWCNNSNNNVQDKDQYIRTILAEAKPDILTVNEFGATTALLENFLDNNLNVNNINSWKTTPIINQAGSNIINSIFYNSDKVTLQRHRIVQTYLRDIDAYELYLNTPSLENGDTTKFVCIVAHLKAGSSSDDEDKRKIMVENTMRFIKNNYPYDNVMFMGDCNFYSASEPGFQLMTTYSDENARLLDPLGANASGDWNNNPAFASIHTQSTNNGSGGCASTGGMDDRFDFIMISNELRFGTKEIRYVQQSYQAFGQDGNRFNGSITSPVNNSIPSEVASALQSNSDHLPVILKLATSEKLSIDQNLAQQTKIKVYPNPVRNQANVSFTNQEPGNIRFEIINLQGQIVDVYEKHFNIGTYSHQLDIQNLKSGFYLLQLSNSRTNLGIVKLMVQ